VIDRPRLLEDLQKTTKLLVDDLRERTDEVPEVGEPLRRQHREARDAGRTDRTYEEWREDLLAQVAVGWVLATVFVRFCEDNGLYGDPLLSGPGDRRGLARDHRVAWLARHPAKGDREWLLEVFGRYRDLPATAGVFGKHNALWQFGPSADGAKALLEVWWAVDIDTGELRHDFADPGLDTRFLGDLYQDLSEHAKKNYALLQTPDFVEAFILDRTLDPAIEVFGLEEAKLIDPTCGSGHFLLGAFDRILARWREREPATSVRELAQRALDAVHGVDLNPFAVAIARFRLLVAALKACGIRRLVDAPDFRLHVAAGDSLLHGTHGGRLFKGTEGHGALMRHRYPTEDAEEADRILEAGRYHAVVGNPPYITVKDPAVRTAYREMYDSASGQYSLGVPFTERFFDLAKPTNPGTEAGFVGVITANSFMKRSFGRKLVEDYLPTVDLTHILDTSGAYIPGHGTPTVILFGRHRPPGEEEVRAVLGIRGEPGTPRDPRRGEVWSSIEELVDEPGAENEYISVEDVPRDRYSNHPWSLQGGAAPDVLKMVSDGRVGSVGEAAAAIGRTTHTGEDGVYLLPPNAAETRHWMPDSVPLVEGQDVRDFLIKAREVALFPYVPSGERRKSLDEMPMGLKVHLWRYRTQLKARLNYGETNEERGLSWWEYSMFFADRFRTPLSITFAFVATHNHFVLDRGGKVFKQSAPVIKLPDDATEDDHLRLLGLLNSSTACFWAKQVFHGKGQGGVGQESRAEWEEFVEHDGTKLKQFPIPARTPLTRARELDALAQELERHLPAKVLAKDAPTRDTLAAARKHAEEIRARMVALQEELDWECYHLYGLTDRDLSLPSSEVPEIARGERAFEIALARDLEAGRKTSTWFARHGTTPVTELPASWPDRYRAAVEHRLDLIASDRKLGLLERPEYKRRWNWAPWEEMEKEALRTWLLDRLEDLPCWTAPEPELQTAARLADQLREAPHALEAARLFTGRPDVDLTELVGTLLAEESVPHATAYYLSASGRRTRKAWEEVWELQRIEDEIEARTELPEDDPEHLSAAAAEAERKARGVDRIPVPPKYKKSDFRSTTAWRHRGRLDVPKERFIAVPDTRKGADDTAVVGWAGWNHLERAQALAAHYTRRKEAAAEKDELVPLLVGLDELVPWLLQWHNDLDPEWGQRLGDFFAALVDTEARSLGLTVTDLRSWTP
jgi:hypothetical protein